MALRSILKLNVTNIATQLCNPRNFQTAASNVLPIVAQTRGPLYLSPEVTYTQKRTYARNKDFSHLPPLDFEFSGDLESQRPIDPDTLMFKYRNIQEIESLPPDIRKMFTYGHGSGKEKLEHRNAVLQDKVVTLFGPNASLERQVAYLTIKIQNMIPYIAHTRQNKKHKSYLYERIAMRRKVLGYLRRVDYGRFEWLLRELNLTYSSLPRYHYHKQSKKAREKRRIRESFFEVKQEKVRFAKTEIGWQRAEFGDYKQKVLDTIAFEVEKYGITMEEVQKVYEDNLKQKHEDYKKSTVKPKTRWTKLRNTIEQQKQQKEREKWVY